MKVLHIYRTCYPETFGGLENAIRYICKSCIPFDIECKILALGEKKSDRYMHDGTEIILVKKTFEIVSNGFSFGLFTKFLELSKWADIIHYHYPWPTGDLLSLLAPNKKSVITYHSDIVRQKFLKLLYSPLERLALNNANAIIATSPQYAKSSPTLTKYKHKVQIIPLCIDPDAYPEPTSQELLQTRDKYGEGFFLFIGALRYYKGLDYLLSAAKKIPDCNIVIAGEGPLKAELKQRINTEDITNIQLIGLVTEVEKCCLLTLAHAFVFPSHLRSEAFGVSLLEAQLFSKPIISCEISTGSSYVNINLNTGLTVEAKNPTNLARSMSKLNAEHHLAKKLGCQGKERLKKLFNLEKTGAQHNYIYEAL